MKVDFFIKPSQVLSRTSGLVPEHHSVISQKPLTRRQLLMGMAGVGTALGVAACTRSGSLTGQAEVAAAESARPTTGAVRTMTLNPRPVNIDLGGRIASTWAYGDTVPGKPLRAMAGDRVQVAVRNDLPESTSVHWHGLAIRNDMDGVPGVTTPAIDSGGTFDFEFVVPDPGTHWFHPHTGLQLDRGLYAPFIIDDPREPGDYDAEWVIVLDDWTDGIGQTPDQIYADLVSAGQDADSGRGMGMGGSGMGHGMMGDSGDVTYPMYLLNGRPGNDPETFTAKPGERVRLRIINAGADTIFTVALADHRLRVTHTDGFPVRPVPTSAIRIGMGERYDAVVDVSDGAFALVAEPLGKSGLARAILRTSRSAPAPSTRTRPAELDSYPLQVTALQVSETAALPAIEPDSTQDVALAGTMAPYVWTINGATHEHATPLTITQGQTGRLRITNMSMMSHPLHLHGHTFQLGDAGGTGARKDTLLIPPMGAAAVDFAANNPGQWMVHCHNAYHAEAGMMTRLDYTT